MGLRKGFARTLRRLTGILYRFPKAMRRSGRMEVSLLWKSSGCKYTCHAQCRDQVALDCHQNGSINGCQLSPLAQDHLNNNQSSHSDVEKEKELRTHLTYEEIRHKVEQYNTESRDHFKMTLNTNGTYTGFIKVQLDLRRPITVKGGRPGGVKGQEAFYLPRGSINTLHISSTNTVRQVIEALLRKFTVADNPAKFALFKRFSREDQVYTCKLSEEEHPLFLRLVAGPSTDVLSFVLKEQQTGEVLWDAFSIPELQNFLRFLDKEEQDQICSITRRYSAYREKLEEAMRATGGPG
ncbi:ras association domain-containing protein 3 isoform X2 [Cyprinus carpio]|uniref:Ras association domain-containing protein 3 isoform X2 n=1 Tax=Cyprinus carpio TaxID=7962 RepID=A0A9Q9W6C0_CYPCA|nr:ras association domain-containing protein 3 isoform X2 [Cyprinus carpio]